MAVAAIGVASLFVGVLLAWGISAFVAKKPLLQPEFLALAAVGLVLSFAARRVIRNAEGTRTGENLANAAWWICLIAGLGYGAYLLAIDFAIRRDARAALDRWIERINAGDDESINDAFLRTREPAQRGQISPKDTAQIDGRFRDDYLAFRQTDLVRIARRNQGDCQIVPSGVKEWMYRAGGIDCAFSGTMKCPEGIFPFLVGIRGVEQTGGETAGRQWWIVFNAASGFITRDQRRLTSYGWMLMSLEESAASFAGQFLQNVRSGPWTMPYAYHAMIKPDPILPARTWQLIASTTPGRIAVAGGITATRPYTDDYVRFSFPDHFFKATGGKEPSPEQRALFKAIWDTSGILPPGSRVRNSPDTTNMATITETSVEVRIPCELPFPSSDTGAVARGKLVVVSTEPGLVQELKRLRSEANPDNGTSTPPLEILQRDFKWRLVRLESDLVKVQMVQRMEGGGDSVEGP
jgi:hypothetical protein